MPPVMLTYVQAATMPSVSLVTRVSTANFYVAAHGPSSTPDSEFTAGQAGLNVGWLAVNPGAGLVGGLHFEASRQVVSTGEFSFGNPFSDAPLLFASAYTSGDLSPLCVFGSDEATVATFGACAQLGTQFSDELDLSFLSLSGSGEILMVPGEAPRCQTGSFLCECFANPSGELLGSGCEDAPQYTNAAPHLLPLPCQQVILHGVSSFSAKWSGEIVLEDGLHSFVTASSDASSLFLGGRLIIANENGCCALHTATPLRLQAGIYNVDFEALYTARNDWFATLTWESSDVLYPPYIALSASTNTNAGATIAVNGSSIVGTTAGFNIGVVNPVSGAVDSFASFDTQFLGAALAMRDFLLAVPMGYAVLIATQGTVGSFASVAATQLRELAAPELAADGSSAAFVLISCKLCVHHRWVRHALAEDGAAVVSVSVPLSLQWVRQERPQAVVSASEHVSLNIGDGQTLANSNSSICVPVSAGADSVDDAISAYSVQLQLDSRDSLYAGTMSVLGAIQVIDDDVAALYLSRDRLEFAEGLNSSYQIRLASKPAHDVDVILKVVRSKPMSPSAATVCHTATEGDECFDNVQWAKEVGFHSAPTRYPCLTQDSSFEEYQFFLYSCCPEQRCTVPCRLDASTACAADPASAWAGGLELSLARLHFTAATWNQSQTVVVQAPNDDVDLGVEYSFVVEHIASSADAKYNGLIGHVQAIVEDDDSSDVSLSGFGLTVLEGGGFTYSISLQSRPLDLVSIFVTVDLEGATWQPTRLLVWPHEWNETQNVTVAIGDDSVDLGSQTCTARHMFSTSDSHFQWSSATSFSVSVAEDDVAGMRLDERENNQARGSDLVVSEAGLEATYEIRLTSQPLEDVTIYMHHTGHQLIFSPPNLTFSHEAWNATQMVRLSAVDDQIDEGENSTIHVWHTTASADPMYADSVLGRLGNVTVTVEDDDESVILASQQQLIVREGERGGHSNPGVAAACNLLLDDDDTPYVLCNDRCALESQCDTTPRDECVQSCFAREYWAVVDQSSAGAGHECSTVCMRHGVDSYQYEDDGNCSCLSLRGDASVQQAIQRSSTGNGCTMCSQRAISAADVSVVSELLQATYDLVLLSQPISDMNISITPHGGLQVDPRWVVFNSSSWYMNQEITVWAVDDLVTERFEFAEVLHAVSSSEDPFYGDANFAVQSVDVTVVDDDTARVHLSTASMELNETGQSSAVYSVWLSSPPESNVTVTLHFDEEELTAEPSRLVFSSNTWSVRQEVTVVTVDDMVDSGDLWPTMIAHKVNSDDVFYDDVYTRNISVALLDNDVARVRIAPRNGNVTEGGAHDAYNISLTSEPTANVTVYVLGEALDDQQLRVDPEQLVFIPTNWNQPQMVQVTAVDDDIAEGTTQQFLFHNTSSDDPWYGNAFARPFVVRVTDNDEAVVVETIDDVGPSSNGTTVAVRDSGSDFALYEGGRSARACVTLSAQPLGVVVVQPFVQLCASTARDGNSSAECIPGFDGVVALVECDIEPFNLYRMVDVLRVNSSESGFSSWAVHANEINASGCFGAAVEFLPDTWDMPVCFDIFAPEDNIDEAQLQMRVVYNITSAAVLYNANQTQFGGTLALYDNDDAGIALVDEIDLVVSEAGLEATYEIRLTSQPLEDVTI